MKLNTNTRKEKIFFIIILLSIFTLITSITLLFIKRDKILEPIDESWGLGKVVTESVSNDRDYEWYVDQCATGEYGQINCGPASMEMIVKWKNKNSTIKAEALREKFLLDGHGTVDGIVCAVLSQNYIDYERVKMDITPSFTKTSNERLIDKVKKDVKKGNIVLVALNTGTLTWNFSVTQRTGKYCLGSANHYIIVKGYKVVDKKLYFEVYDPYSSGWKYDDGTLWGKNRYYLASEVIEGCYSLTSISK